MMRIHIMYFAIVSSWFLVFKIIRMKNICWGNFEKCAFLKIWKTRQKCNTLRQKSNILNFFEPFEFLIFGHTWKNPGSPSKEIPVPELHTKTPKHKQKVRDPTFLRPKFLNRRQTFFFVSDKNVIMKSMSHLQFTTFSKNVFFYPH